MSSRSSQTVNSVKRLLHINKLLRYFYRGLISNYLNKLHKANLVPISKKQKLAIGYLVSNWILRPSQTSKSMEKRKDN